MSVIKSNGAGSGASGFYKGVATQSLRFNDDDSAVLSKTFSSAGDRRLWTFATWFKISEIGDGALFAAFQTSAKRDVIRILSGVINFQIVKTGISTINSDTTMVFRDPSAWYHLVVQYNSADSTETNRTKMWVNGVQQTLSEIVGQNVESHFGHSQYHAIGARRTDTGNYDLPFDGYYADTYYVNGQALDYTSFAEFKNGVLIPKKYTGSYGTNSFRLEYNQTGTGTASSSTIGADTSGEGNHLTSTNVVASDCNMPDSPENNFSTMNTLDKVDSVLAEGSLKTTGAGNSFDTVRSTFAMPSGSWYAEFLCHAGTGNGNNHVGISTQSEALSGISGSNFLGSSATSYSYSDNDNVYNNGSITNSTGTTYTAGDIIGVTFTGSEIKWYKNNSLIATVSSITGNDYCFTTTSYSTSMGMFANFGQDSSFAGAKTAQGNTDGNGQGDFYYAPPSGFLALCSSNLSEPTIGPNSDTQADEHFDTVLWTGNATDRNITDLSFKPDWVWTKSRSAANSHYLFNSTRGVLKDLEIDNNDAESTEADSLEAFLSNGFSLGTNNNTNANTVTFVAWNWKANGGTTTTNDASATGVGSRDSVYQANTTAGFSIVTYDGDSSDQNGTVSTIAHGLGAVPRWILFKPLDARDGCVYHAGNTSAPETERLILFSGSGTLATADDSGFFNDTAPTSTVFTIGARTHVNSNGGMIAFCFAEIEGYSKFGSYTANNSTDNAFVYTGFRPAFVMVKATALSQEWAIIDNVRDSTNDNSSNALYPNYQNAESTDGSNIVDFLSNGFKIRSTASVGYLTGVYVYMAFAEAPFKYANAR